MKRFLQTISILLISMSSFGQNWWEPNNYSLTNGTIDSGTMSNVYIKDATYFTVREGNGTNPGFLNEFTWINVPVNTLLFYFYGRYEGSSSHIVDLQWWDYVNSVWRGTNFTTKDFPYSATDYEKYYSIPTPFSYFVSDPTAEVKVRVIHSSVGNPTHVMKYDQLILVTMTPTSTPTSIYTNTPTPTSTATSTPTPTSATGATNTPTVTNTPTPLATPTPTSTPNLTPTPTIISPTQGSGRLFWNGDAWFKDDLRAAKIFGNVSDATVIDQGNLFSDDRLEPILQGLSGRLTDLESAPVIIPDQPVVINYQGNNVYWFSYTFDEEDYKLFVPFPEDKVLDSAISFLVLIDGFQFDGHVRYGLGGRQEGIQFTLAESTWLPGTKSSGQFTLIDFVPWELSMVDQEIVFPSTPLGIKFSESLMEVE